jgi:hypothetical protein
MRLMKDIETAMALVHEHTRRYSLLFGLPDTQSVHG